MLSIWVTSLVVTFDPATILSLTDVSPKVGVVDASCVQGPGDVVPAAYSKKIVPPDSRKRSHCMVLLL